MPASPIHLSGREVRIHKASLYPKFSDQTVLTSDFWKYVELWLRRKKSKDAIFYWSQAQNFYKASGGLNDISAPLTLYYCFLNAVKALLECHGVPASPYHGTSGQSTTKNATLTGEKVIFRSKGIAPALGKLLNDTDTRSEYTLKQLLYNLVFVHRAFVLTFPKEPEMFVPLRSTVYVRKNGGTETWLQLEADQKFDSSIIDSNIPLGFERDTFVGPNILRTKKRFKWLDGADYQDANLRRIATYNTRYRSNLVYIRGKPPSWYLKLPGVSRNSIARSGLSMMLAAMHRLSELSRYDPLRLNLLLVTEQNWLISEFIGSAPIQFLEEIATEITGQNLATPFVRSSR
ncbi:YaaC family protein [Novosphingobium humi]|uniref:YaaC family protein n=1 Tax=Novosphingobium humi TaxID=2282397 RepID=UPI0025AED329|nr:YaaC family protein [Novosphingobium humi]WJS98212.1 YaaC family protein [Novosphingobium humi]